jgi:tetratricopeptide (TPR) repeat protein
MAPSASRAGRAGGLPPAREARRWRSVVAAALLLAVGAAGAAVPDLPRAKQLLADGRYPEAYELLLPFAETAQADAAFHRAFGEAALRTQRAEQARQLFERALALEPGSVDAHLGLGRAYLAKGEYARAKIEFETVLRFDDLPPDLETQAEIYAQAALAYAQGRRLLASGYALLGYGNYRVGSAGGGPENDAFYSARLGGRVNVELDDRYALVGSLDWRFRDYYDNDDRRNDSDLRWNGALTRNVGEGNWVAGLRGRVSYRGEGIYRNDFGVYGNYRLRLDEDNQISAGLELRQRRYPSNSRLRERTRNIVELSGSWTHALLDGRASFTLDGQAGREFNTERADGDANFFGLSPSLGFSITENLGGSVYFWWQNDRYHIERLGAPGDRLVGIGTRNDHLYEAGASLSWQFMPSLSLNPEIVYIRDTSNILAAEYSSTEIWITLRWDF